MTGENLATALAAFQAKLPPIAKTKTAKVKTKSGDTYTYSYADLAEVSAVVLPLLGAVGLSFTARPTFNDDGRFALAYSLMHINGDTIDGVYPLPQAGTPQEIGSAITYARRYALCSVVGVSPDEDDDGAAAKDKRPAETTRPEFDPAEQQVLFDAWSDEIGKAKSSNEISAIGKSLLAGKRKGEISPNTYAKLAALGGRRKAEIDLPEVGR